MEDNWKLVLTLVAMMIILFSLLHISTPFQFKRKYGKVLGRVKVTTKQRLKTVRSTTLSLITFIISLLITVTPESAPMLYTIAIGMTIAISISIVTEYRSDIEIRERGITYGPINMSYHQLAKVEAIDGRLLLYGMDRLSFQYYIVDDQSGLHAIPYEHYARLARDQEDAS